MSIFVTNVDELYEEFKSTGAIIRQSPTNFPRGRARWTLSIRMATESVSAATARVNPTAYRSRKIDSNRGQAFF
jgi:hypothetical protein